MNMLKDNGGIAENILQAIEQYWEFRLPNDYRNFLLTHNGGESENTIFRFYDQSDGSCLVELFGIIKDNCSNLLINATYSGNRIPDNMLAIGNDVYGNLILLTTKGKDRNKVYFWDHELEADIENGEVADYSNLTLIAESFGEFVEGLSKK